MHPLITETDEIGNFKIYPNPALDRIFIRVNAAEKYTYSLYNLNGNKMLDGNGAGNAEIGILNLPAGLYLMQCTLNGKVQNLPIEITKE